MRAAGPPLGRGRADASSSGRTTNRWWPVVGIGLAVWASIPPYLGPALDTSRRVEVADHVVPAVVVVVACLLAAVHRVRSAGLVLGCALVVVLAGLWMTLTHLPLLAQANRGEVPWGSALHHTVPCLGMLVFGVVWTAAAWLSGASDDPVGS